MSSVQYAKDQPAGFKNRVEKVAIVGAGGYIGRHITAELLKTGRHTVTAITRANSKNVLPAGVQKAVVDYDDQDSLVAGLKGHDFLVITLSVRTPRDTNTKLAKAAAAAGITYIMPNSYGPNPHNLPTYDEQGFGPAFRAMVAEFESYGLKPVTLSCGFWYEFSLAGGTYRYGFDIANRKFVQFDDGDVKIFTSTWPQCGRGAAALLSLPILPQDAADKKPTLSKYAWPNTAYVSSFHVDQRDMFASLKRVTKTTDADWTITRESSRARWENAQKVLAAGPTAAGAVELDGKTPLSFFQAYGMNMYTRIFFPGGDGLTEDQLANKDLGLPQEDFDEWTREAVRLVESGELSAYGQD